MIRVNDGKPSVSRRKSSSPQKRVVDALTMVDRAEATQDSKTDFTPSTIKTEQLSLPYSASTSTTNHGALDTRILETAGSNAGSSLNKAQCPTSSYKTVKDQSLYGRAASQKQIDINALYGDAKAIKVEISGESATGLPLCPPPAPIRKKRISDILPPIMPSGATRLEEARSGGVISRGKKMIDVRELYGTRQDNTKSMPPNGPISSKKKLSKDSKSLSMTKASTIQEVIESDTSFYPFQVTEMGPHDKSRPGCVISKEMKYDPSSENSSDRCELNSMPTKDFVTSSNRVTKKRARKSDPTSGQPTTKKKAASSSASRQTDADASYRSRNVYESDCTSNAASDTGTLPQGTNAKPRSNVCPYKECSQSFARPWRLAAHIRKHKGERPFRCEVEGCTRDYTNPSHLRRHVLRNHSEPGEKLKCPSDGCFMTLASAATLKRHIERRHGPCNFECELCHLKFRKHGELRVHRLTHNPSLDLLYVCAVCNSGFNDKRLHKKHLRTHRTYPCLVTNCNQVFSTWTIFLKHTKNDHPASKYVCDVCSRAFTVKKNLEFHLETHKNFSERTKLTCQYRNCNKFYFQQRNLTAHVKRCHCNDTFDCPYPNCTSKLSTKQKLSLHLESVHGLARGSGMQFAKLDKKIEATWEGTDAEILTVKCEVPE